MREKSIRGIAMMSLVIYVSSFLIIAALVGTISTYFYNNMQVINKSVGANAEYNKLNLYILHYLKSAEFDSIRFEKENYTEDSSYMVFTINKVIDEDDIVPEKHVIVKPAGTNSIYFDQVLLCSNVTDFKIRKGTANGKEFFTVTVKIGDTAFSTRYVIG